jgi:hypothetical protein
VSPFCGNLVFSEDRFYGTLGNTGVTIDASLGIDNQHVIVKVKSFYRTDKSAIRVTTVHARFSNHVSHSVLAS